MRSCLSPPSLISSGRMRVRRNGGKAAGCVKVSSYEVIVAKAASFGTTLRGKASKVGSVSARVSSRARSEEHTSELQSPCNLVCRLLLEKKKYKLRSIIGDLKPGWSPVFTGRHQHEESLRRGPRSLRGDASGRLHPGDILRTRTEDLDSA